MVVLCVVGSWLITSRVTYSELTYSSIVLETITTRTHEPHLIGSALLYFSITQSLVNKMNEMNEERLERVTIVY